MENITVLSPEQEPEPEPEVLPETEPEVEPESSGAEPVPDWSTARDLWSWTWQLHTYGLGCTFLAIAIFSYMRLHVTCHSNFGKITNAVALRLILFVCLFLTTLFRSLSLLIDPYGSCDIVSILFVNIMWSLTFPFMSAGLNLLLFILLETTKMTSGHDHSRNMLILGIGTCIYIILTLSTDIIVFTIAPMRGLTFFCQVIFIVWSTAIMIGYCFVGYRVRRNLRNSMSVKKSEADERRLTRFLRLVFACAFVGLCFMAAQLFSICGVYGVYSSSDEAVEPWSWLIFQSCMRVAEIAICCLIHSLVSNDSKYANTLKTFKLKISAKWNSIIKSKSTAVSPFTENSNTTSSVVPRK